MSKILPLEVSQCTHAKHIHQYDVRFCWKMTSLARELNFLIATSDGISHTPEGNGAINTNPNSKFEFIFKKEKTVNTKLGDNT